MQLTAELQHHGVRGAEQKAVADSRCAPERGRREATKPNRDRLGRQRQNARAIDAVIAALIVEHGRRPESPQQLDLLVEALAARRERLVQRLIFDVVPARTNAELEAIAREQRELRALLRDQRRLPLRQDDHARNKLELLGERCEVAEQHERLVERVVLGVRAAESRFAPRVHRAEHVVVGDQVRIAELLCGLREVADRDGVAADLAGGEHAADLHGWAPRRAGRAVRRMIWRARSGVNAPQRRSPRYFFHPRGFASSSRSHASRIASSRANSSARFSCTS